MRHATDHGTCPRASAPALRLRRLPPRAGARHPNASSPGTDTLAVLPTGAGKSVCFQIPAMALGGLTVVVSPLISLMQDQVAAAEGRGIPAACLTSGLSADEQAGVRRRVLDGSLAAALPLPRAAGALRAGAPRRRGAAVAPRGGRGALHRRMGARFPAQLSGAAGRSVPAGPAAGRRAHRQRHAGACGRRSRGPSASRRPVPPSTWARSTGTTSGSAW